MFLQITNVSVSYRGAALAAVRDLSMRLNVGEIGVLIGPSGCGKTTLLRAVAGLEPISAGSIAIGSQVVSTPTETKAPERRRVGMVFQDYALFPHLDVARNVAFGIKHLDKPARKARVHQVLALVGLADVQHRYPHELSGGQQQRVALARALAPEPDLLLLDEPFSNLDVELRERLAHELRGILKSAGITALFVTHDQLEAFAVGDKIGVMQGGTLHQWDEAYELYHRPTTRFVADFIGHGVFSHASVEEHFENGALHKHVVTPLGELHDIKPEVLAALSLGDCEVLLRADDIVHDDASPVQAQIVRKAFRGSEFLYTLQLKTGETVLAHVPSHHDHKLGEWIGIKPEVDHVVTFAVDKKSILSVESYPPMHSRPCSFGLCFHDGSVYADFDLDKENRVFLRGISFDGHGYCPCGDSATKMEFDASQTLRDAVQKNSLTSAKISNILRNYFRENKSIIWTEALCRYELI